MSEPKEIFYDLETPRWSDEVEGGWSNISAFGMSVAVTWDDENSYRTWMEHNAGELVKELNRADVVAITSLTPQIYSAFDVAKMAKEQGATTIIGGYHASLAPNYVAKNL